MSNLPFSNSEIRLATVALGALSLSLPALYWMRNSNQPTSESQALQTFRKYLKAYSTLRPQALVANASSDFYHQVLPLSLELPFRTLEPFKTHASMIFSLFEDFSMTPQAPGIHYSESTGYCVAHCKMGGKVNAQSPMGQKLIAQGLGEWWTECVLFVKISPDGRKVVEVREFVHSAKAEELKNRMAGVLES